MGMGEQKIKSFKDLNAWKETHKLVLMIYKITRQFPKEEMFVIVSQIRRCAISISSNIAEGFSRKTKKEKIQFYHTALGSTNELQNQLLISRDLGYLNKENFMRIADQTVKVNKLVNGLIKSSKDHT